MNGRHASETDGPKTVRSVHVFSFHRIKEGEFTKFRNFLVNELFIKDILKGIFVNGRLSYLIER